MSGALQSRAKIIMDKVSTQQASSGHHPLTAAAGQPLSSSANLVNKTTDVLETAVRLGVKIIAASRMLEFLEQNVFLPGTQQRDHSPSVMKSVKAIPILGTFIKLESADQRSRPITKVFRTWPELVLEPGHGCPFRLSSVSTEVSDRMISEQKRKQQQQQRKDQAPAGCCSRWDPYCGRSCRNR